MSEEELEGKLDAAMVMFRYGSGGDILVLVVKK